MRPQPLGSVSLDRSQLNIFVCGPGQGETIVIALPGEGWVVLDGAGSEEDFPAHVILDACSGDEPIELVALTHPHRDHYAGLRDLLEREDLAERIRRVGCVGRHVGRTHAFAKEVEALESASGVPAYHAGEVRGVLERIRSLWAERPSTVLDLREGPVTLGSTTVQVEFLSPTVEEVARFFEADNLPGRIRQGANDLSAVLSLTFGASRYLFGADLPESTPVSSGWNAVLDRHPNLNVHRFLKLPHHGSDEAQPPGLFAKPAAPLERTWCVTPFNASNLPRFEPGRGVYRVSQYEDRLHLTALPRSKKAREQMDAETPIATVASAPPTRALPLGKGAVPIRAGRDNTLKAIEGYWLFGFDQHGHCRTRARGSLATALIR